MFSAAFEWIGVVVLLAILIGIAVFASSLGTGGGYSSDCFGKGMSVVDDCGS